MQASLPAMSNWLPVAALVMLAIISTYVLKGLNDEDAKNATQTSHIADFYLEKFTMTVMDEAGRPKRELIAEYMAHFADNQTKELTQPHMIIYHETRPPWHIKSERGWVSANDDVMLLLGKVHIWRDDHAGVRVLDIETQDFRVLPETEYGETDKHVVIRTPSSETTGTGMRVYLQQRRLELLSGVNTVYEQN